MVAKEFQYLLNSIKNASKSFPCRWPILAWHWWSRRDSWELEQRSIIFPEQKWHIGLFIILQIILLIYMPYVAYNCCYIFGDFHFLWSQIGFSTCSISIYIQLCLGLDLHLLQLVILEQIHIIISYIQHSHESRYQ